MFENMDGSEFGGHRKSGKPGGGRQRIFIDPSMFSRGGGGGGRQQYTFHMDPGASNEGMGFGNEKIT